MEKLFHTFEHEPVMFTVERRREGKIEKKKQIKRGRTERKKK